MALHAEPLYHLKGRPENVENHIKLLDNALVLRRDHPQWSRAFDPGASKDVQRNPYLFRPCLGPSNWTRKYFLRTNERLASECGGQPSHFIVYKSTYYRIYQESQWEYVSAETSARGGRMYPPSWCLRYRKPRQRLDRHLGPQPHVERVQDLAGPLSCDAEIFVSLIARDLRLVHIQTSRAVRREMRCAMVPRPASLSRAPCSSSRFSLSPNLFEASWHSVSLRIKAAVNSEAEYRRISFQAAAECSRGSISRSARFVSAERSAVRRSYIDCKFSQNCAVPPK